MITLVLGRVVVTHDHALLVTASFATTLATARIDDVTYTRKAELHVTVYGSVIGAAVAAALALPDCTATELTQALAPLVPAHARFIAPLAQLRRRRHGTTLDTLVHAVDAPVDVLRRAVAKLLGRHAPAALHAPSWPHVTLFTSEPTGHAGIGVADAATMARALARGLVFIGDGLGAKQLG